MSKAKDYQYSQYHWTDFHSGPKVSLAHGLLFVKWLNGLRRLLRTLLEAGADVTVGVGSAVVVHVEQPVIQVLVIVATAVQTRVARVEVPVIRDGAEMNPPTAAQAAPRIALLIPPLY